MPAPRKCETRPSGRVFHLRAGQGGSGRAHRRLAAALRRLGGIRVDEVEDQRADVLAPARAREDAVMARARFEVLGLLRLGQAGEQLQRRNALPGRRDVVIAALDGVHRDRGDLADVDALAFDGEAVLRDLEPLEDAVHGREVELCRHVHHREVFVVEDIVMVAFAALALGLGDDLLLEGIGVLFHVHRDEGGKLHQPGIDHPPRALVLEADALDHQLLELAHRHPAAEVGDLGRGGVGVDRAADQGQRARLRGGVFRGQIGGSGQRQRRRLAHRDDVDVGSEEAHEIDEIEGVILDVELALAHRDVAGVVPVRHVDFTVRQQARHGGAEESRVMARHRGDEEHAAGHLRPALHLEMHERPEGFVEQRLDLDGVVAAVDAGNRADPPVGLDHHPREAALGHPAPGREQLEHRMGRQPPDRVGGHGPRRGAHPLVRIPDGLHQVVAHHALHRNAFTRVQNPSKRRFTLPRRRRYAPHN
ncbi:hypothetical protein SDC9_39436 [bioreactor metagenome]|uniref:Uncharacterized protein n=1 Tax=bioreactor metagenome TaxID=1076179 RepID=A0A644VQ30_9ZZZZ